MDKVSEKNKKSYWVKVVIAAIVGGIIGSFVYTFIGIDGFDIKCEPDLIYAWISFTLMIVIIIALITSYLYYLKLKKYVNEEGEYSQLITVLIDKASCPIVYVNILFFLALGLMLYAIKNIYSNVYISTIMISVMMLSYFVSMNLKQKIIKVSKGVFFTKDFDLYDEEEIKDLIEKVSKEKKEEMYEATFKAFNTMNKIFSFVTILLSILTLAFGLNPTYLITWGTANLIYTTVAIYHTHIEEYKTKGA